MRSISVGEKKGQGGEAYQMPRIPEKAAGFSVITYICQRVSGTYNCRCNPDVAVTYCEICYQNKMVALKNAGDSHRQIRRAKKLEMIRVLNKRCLALEEGLTIAQITLSGPVLDHVF
jgi:hypothetical protein